MKLIAFEDVSGKKTYVNPEHIQYLYDDVDMYVCRTACNP